MVFKLLTTFDFIPLKYRYKKNSSPDKRKQEELVHLWCGVSDSGHPLATCVRVLFCV